MRILIIVLLLSTITNVTYASFPMPEILETESVSNTSIVNSPAMDVLLSILGFLVGFFSFMLLFLPLFLLFVPNKRFRKGIIIGLIVIAIPLVLALSFYIISYITGAGLVIM